MPDKSYVTMETQVCPVCGKEEDTGSILLDTRMHQRFARRTPTGWGLCKEHADLYAKGFVAFVEATNEPLRGDRLNPGDAVRTGRVLHLAAPAAVAMFNIPADKDGKPIPMCFCPPEVIDRILARAKQDGVEPVDPQRIELDWTPPGGDGRAN